jgi:putative ABC transport system permease protein
MTIMLKLYSLSLRWLPADLRADFGADMAQLFRDQLLATRGAVARLGLLMAAIGDVAAQSARRGASRPAAQRTPPLSNLPADFRQGLRLLRRYPAIAIAAVVTLALGIGTNVAIFSVADAVLLRALPYKDPDQLVMIRESRVREHVSNNVVSLADFVDWRAKSQSFAGMFAFTGGTMLLSGAGEPEQLTAGLATAGFPGILGVPLVMGRGFQPDDEVIGKHRVAILTYGLWQRQFGGDPSIVGRGITLSGRPYVVIGVLPASFAFVDASIEIYRPLPIDMSDLARGAHAFDVFARLKPDVSFDAAHAEMVNIGLALERAYPGTNTGHGANVVSMRSELVGPVRNGLMVLVAGVGLVLLLASVNVANLMLVRGAKRAREMSVRAALGADRRRLISQNFAESLAIAAAGGALGVGLAALLVRALPLVLPEQLAIVRTETLHLDVRVLGAALVFTMASSFVFGLLPALKASQSDVVEALKQGGRGNAVISRRTRVAIVVSEVMLASLTLVGAGLIVRSLLMTSAQPLGLDPHDRVVLELSAPTAKYPTEPAQAQAMLELQRRLAAIPGVSAVGGIDALPLSGDDMRRDVVIEGAEVAKDLPVRMHPRSVTPSYFGAAGMTLVRGRGFTDADRADAPLVSVVTATAARQFWPGQDAIGKRWKFDSGADSPWISIVGIVEDVRHWGLSEPVRPMVFQPFEQRVSPSLVFVSHTTLPTAAFAAAARDAVHGVDSSLPVGNLRTFDDVVAKSVRATRALATLMSIFGALALLLAAIGIYGVMSELVQSRAHEIGLRSALGARPAQIAVHFLAGCAWQTVAGLVVGCVAAVAAMSSVPVLFQVAPWDPTTLFAVAITVLGASLAACLIPVARALRIDPITAIRE